MTPTASGEPRAESPGLSRFADRVEHKTPRNRPWLAASALLLALGAVGSVFGALAVARNQGQQSRQASTATAMAISSTFQLAIQHEQDLVIGAGAFVVRNPDASQADFVQWTSTVRAFQRYPEVVGIAHLALVPASQLERVRGTGNGGSGGSSGCQWSLRSHPGRFASLLLLGHGLAIANR